MPPATRAAEAKTVGAGKAIVVGIVGSAHLEAIAALYAGAGGFLDEVDDVLVAPLASKDGSYGVRRAILERLLLLRSPVEVVEEAVAVLGEVTLQHLVAYEATHEVYASCRMLLACLPQEQLASVVGGRAGADMWATLAPLRAVRPANGGPGWSDEVLSQLRALTPNL